jgi:hypothetical protein
MSYDKHSHGYLLREDATSLQVGPLSLLRNVENNNTPEMGDKYCELPISPDLPLGLHQAREDHLLIDSDNISALGQHSEEHFAQEPQPLEDKSNWVSVPELASSVCGSPDIDRILAADQYMDTHYPGRVPSI